MRERVCAWGNGCLKKRELSIMLAKDLKACMRVCMFEPGYVCVCVCMYVPAQCAIEHRSAPHTGVWCISTPLSDVAITSTTEIDRKID